MLHIITCFPQLMLSIRNRMNGVLQLPFFQIQVNICAKSFNIHHVPTEQIVLTTSPLRYVRLRKDIPLSIDDLSAAVKQKYSMVPNVGQCTFVTKDKLQVDDENFADILTDMKALVVQFNGIHCVC